MKGRADSRDPAEFWPQRLFAFELRRGDTQLGPMLGSQQGEHCPPAPPKSIKRQATAGVTWRRFVPGRWLPDRATPLLSPSIGPLRRQELTGAWRVMKTAGSPPSTMPPCSVGYPGRSRPTATPLSFRLSRLFLSRPPSQNIWAFQQIRLSLPLPVSIR